jgi:hypothetical protein
MVAAGERPPTSSHNASYRLSKILPDSWACRLFVITVLVETTIDLAIEGDLLVRLQDSGDNGSALKMPVYLSVFALAQYASPFIPRPCFDIQHSIFQLVLAVDAVYAQNTLQFICLMLVGLERPPHLSDISL